MDQACDRETGHGLLPIRADETIWNLKTGDPSFGSLFICELPAATKRDIIAPQQHIHSMGASQNDFPKRKLIKDPLWGSTAILPWEEVLIEHPIFSRLNSILQNSSAYRVYPSLRVSRFSHSLGVMYVASRLFQSALLQHDREGLFRPDQAIEKTHEQPDVAKEQSLEAEALDLAAGISNQNRIVDLTRRIFPLHHYDGTEASAAFHVCHAMLRIAALLHDLGHLPYSHIFEFALFAAVNVDLAWTSEGNANEQKRTRDDFVKLVKSHPPGKLHEHFGEMLMSFLGHNCEKTIPHVPIDELMAGAIDILHTHNHPILRSFVSGDVDADRIDFIRRDCENSGLLHSSVDYERLFTFFQLQATIPLSQTNREEIKYRKQTEVSYVAAPGVRAISEIEKLLSERFQDYRYIACHHRVHLNDELLDRCIVELATKGYLQSLFDCMGRLGTSAGSFGKLEGMKMSTQTMLSLLTEFDDSWLEIKFRELYRRIHMGLDSDWDARAKNLLIAYVEGSGAMVSAFHSDNDFWEYAHLHYPSVCSLRLRGRKGEDPKPEEFENKRREGRLKSIASAVNAEKRQWEEEWYRNTGQLIIIGDVSQKLKVGFSPVASKRYETLLSLSNLHDFLNEKVLDTMPFNFWFLQRPNGEDPKEEIFCFVRDKITTRLSTDSLNFKK